MLQGMSSTLLFNRNFAKQHGGRFEYRKGTKTISMRLVMEKYTIIYVWTFNPITLKEYYEIEKIFNNIENAYSGELFPSIQNLAWKD